MHNLGRIFAEMLHLSINQSTFRGDLRDFPSTMINFTLAESPLQVLVFFMFFGVTSTGQSSPKTVTQHGTPPPKNTT